MPTWEIDILRSFAAQPNGRAENQQIYQTIRGFREITEHQDRPAHGHVHAYQNDVRSHIANLKQKHDLEEVSAGVSQITAQGRKRIPTGNSFAPVRTLLKALTDAAQKGTNGESRPFGPGGESDAHRKLKIFVKTHPKVIGLRPEDGPGRVEEGLPSGDRLDILFARDGCRIAIEVKSSRSSASDIARGLFQCVKYIAVIEAQQVSLNMARNARAILVLEGKLPAELRNLRDRLKIEVREEIIPV